MIRGLLLLIAGYAFALPASANFSATATVFNNPNFCPSSLPGGFNLTVPVEAAAGCNTGAGIGSAQAEAGYGHVGVEASVVVPAGAFPNLNNNAFAQLSTQIVFSGPGNAVTVNGMNIGVSGSAGVRGGNGSGAGFSFDVSLNGVDWGINGLAIGGNGQFNCIPLGNFLCPTLGTTTSFNTSIAGTYTTQPVVVPLNTPVPLMISLAANAGSSDPNASVGVDFAHSIDFPVGVPLFNLPEGYTANAPDMFILDNRFLPPVPVPEPSTVLLSFIGLLFVARSAYCSRRRMLVASS